MSVANLILGPLRGLLLYLERRRGLAVVIVAAAILALGTGSALISRPPVLAPVIEGVTAGFLGLFSRGVRFARFLSGPRPGSSRVMELELELARLRSAERENARLREMLGYDPPPGYKTVLGRVIGLDLDPLRGMAWIDIGTEDGLRGAEAVLTVDGLVGVVDRSWESRARVRLLRNEYTAVSVRDTRSRSLGIVEWDPGQGRLRVGQVPFQADMVVGDTLVSSGLGGVFPPELPVGVVREVDATPERLLKDIELQPFGAFYRLEEVFVVIPLQGPVFREPELPEGEEEP
jgi:rod shape-determining protein MreC